MATHSSILAWKFHGQGSLTGFSPWGHKESDMTEQLSACTHTGIYAQPPPKLVRVPKAELETTAMYDPRGGNPSQLVTTKARASA